MLAEAISAQIIPTDQDPGAREAGVVYFMDRQLMGPYKKHQETYRQGLVGVDETAQAMKGKIFVELSDQDQIAVLNALASGKAEGNTWKTASSSQFFYLLRDHTMQGFYGAPRHGGNRGFVSYRMLELDYPPIIGQNRYKK